MTRFSIAFVLVALTLHPTLFAAERKATLGPHVRPNDGRTAAMFLQGHERSDTIRAIVDQLEDSDLIVYVQIEPQLKNRFAGMLTWLASTPSFRYVRISLNPEFMGDTAIATLGHELQHALEVAREPSIVSADSLATFYRKHGISLLTHESGYDTLAARRTGDDVRRELMGARRATRATETIQDFDPLDWHIFYRKARERSR